MADPSSPAAIIDTATTTTTTTLTAALTTATISLQRDAPTWTDATSWPTWLLSGSPTSIAIAFLVTLALPILLHLYFYTTSPISKSRGSGIPTFLLLGPNSSGKTSLVTLLQRKTLAQSTTSEDEENEAKEAGWEIVASPTRTTQVSRTVGLALPPGIPLGSNKYRSEHDFEVTRSKTTATNYQMVDTPGHGKLRLEHGLSKVNTLGSSLKGILFLLDSSVLDHLGSEVARDVVTYLHDLLLILQRKKDKVPVLVAASKQDLFTALPEGAVRERLEKELESLRSSRSKGISAVDDKDDRPEDDVLGGGGEDKFSFKLLEDEYGITVHVVGGAVKGSDDRKGVRKWEEWIGSCL